MKIPKVKTKDLLKVTDFSKDEIYSIFEYTKFLKSDLKQKKYHNILEKQSLGMIFEKSSTRTRVSFETGMYQLGGQALFLSPNDIQLGRGENISDTAKVLSRYLDGIMIRTFKQSDIEELAANSSIPIINGLTDDYHPCQTLTDFYTIYELGYDINQVKMTYVGDGNNMANSLMLTAAILGADITIACPKDYRPMNEALSEAQEIAKTTGSIIEITDNIEKSVEGADFVYTDVWASMGQEKDTAVRQKAFANYRVTSKLLQKAKQDCKVMHCLPAHRGEEIDATVIDGEKSIVFDEAENRLHLQKAVMCALMAK